MDGGDESRARRSDLKPSARSRTQRGWKGERALIDAFVRLAKGDFTVRLPRNYARDTEDTLAYFVNLIAEELDRLVGELERGHARLVTGVQELSEGFLALAAGDFRARARRTFEGDPLDVLAFLLNNTAEEVGETFSQLEQQRSLLESTLESMVDGLILLDSEGTVTRVNGAMARLLGAAPSALEGRVLRELLGDAEADFADGLVQALSQEALRTRDVTFLRRPDEPITLVVNASAHRDGQGRVLGGVMVVRDERRLRAAQAQLQLTDRLATMGTLAAGVAHEINNPLTYMMGNLEFLAEELPLLSAGTAGIGATLDDLLEAVDSTRAGAARVQRIVADLKTLSRDGEEARAPVDLNGLLESALQMLQRDLRDRAQLRFEPGPVPRVSAAESRLLQVFLNLLQNAMQAVPRGDPEAQWVRVRTLMDVRGRAVVEIADSGPGIAPEVMPRLFDAFFTTRASEGGTGLGLSICHEIITGLGGVIEVESPATGGAVFRVVLPVERGSDAPTAAEPLPRRRVLVIGGRVEQNLGASVRQLLQGAHDVAAVECGPEATARLSAEEFDLVLCELALPERTAMPLYRQLAEQRPDVADAMVFVAPAKPPEDVAEFLAEVRNARVALPLTKNLLTDLLV